MNKFCSECGKELNENINICQNCGFKLNNEQEKQKKKKMPVWGIILIVGTCFLPLIVVILLIGILTRYTIFNITTN